MRIKLISRAAGKLNLLRRQFSSWQHQMTLKYVEIPGEFLRITVVASKHILLFDIFHFDEISK